MHENNRKIMTYPFTGLDYRQINEIGNRVRFSEGKVKYIIPYKDSRFPDMKQQNTVTVTDQKVKFTLCYFRFLCDMCRVKEIPVSDNTYIDTILITLNEILSCSKMNGCFLDYNELLGRFGKKYDKNDLFRLYNSQCEYDYLNDLFSFLYDDSYNCKSYDMNSEVSIGMVQNGMVRDIVNSIITNKDDVDKVHFDNVQTSGPRLTKKLSKVQVI